MFRDQLNNTTCCPRKFLPNLTRAAVLSQTVTVAGGYKPSSVPLSRLSLKEQQEASCYTLLSQRVSVITQSFPCQANRLSSTLAGFPPEHLFLITCPCLYDDPSVGLLSLVVHLPLVCLSTKVPDDRAATTSNTESCLCLRRRWKLPEVQPNERCHVCWASLTKTICCICSLCCCLDTFLGKLSFYSMCGSLLILALFLWRMDPKVVNIH